MPCESSWSADEVQNYDECKLLLDPNHRLETYVEIDVSQRVQLREPELNALHELQTLLKLVYPVVLATALEFTPGFTSIILAGHLKSPNVQQFVDAATLSSMFMNVTAYSVGFGLTSALDTLCSQAYGARRLDKIGIYFQSGLLVVSVCLGAVFLLNWYSERFLLAMGQDPEVAQLAQKFSRWVLLGVPFVFMYELIRKALQAQNIMKPLVVIAIIGNIVNIVVGFVLAYHTSMGFEGIALSRSLGNIVMPLLLIPYFYRYPTHLSQWWFGWNLKEAAAYIGVFLRLGVPGMLMLVMEWWAFELLTLMAGVLPNPVVSVSAHAVLVNVTGMLYMIYAGLAVAANIRVGNCLGANAPKQAKLACHVALALTLSVSTVFGITLYAMRGTIPSLFLNDPDSIATAASVLIVSSLMEVFDGMNAVVQGIFRGAGKQKMAATVNAIAYYVFGIPTAALLGFYFVMGVQGLWMGFLFGVLIAATLQLFMLLKWWKWTELAEEAQERTAE
ncbi:hypothetical protein BBO99_00001322 [Phytophthora kernoviae]|uniref:Multidrug and toxin extrusion protein n=2 Tax=Phytophthora kernoviae TaxID=325452 RepID=A0A3R7J674_9STRA|nr:hypothetical protein G195_011358 [Phytophthora kernoviae 00238/432]KAG2529590.1 hypothetical protein JM16_001978 [Phytophthora kernoviae]KAG2530765.1 hypothetical protein JM18_001154 [Phytophthora kernoviae]RLN10264.1 hypothetical protein BBI17_001189 [Phytophthora kernoviae]RLN84437.1 hypothetical protein BBO99_00001322 [Phytophthora kernoviae]